MIKGEIFCVFLSGQSFSPWSCLRLVVQAHVSQTAIPSPRSSASSRNFLEMQISRSIPQTYWLTNSGSGFQQSEAQQTLQEISTHTQSAEPLFVAICAPGQNSTVDSKLWLPEENQSNPSQDCHHQWKEGEDQSPRETVLSFPWLSMRKPEGRICLPSSVRRETRK